MIGISASMRAVKSTRHSWALLTVLSISTTFTSRCASAGRSRTNAQAIGADHRKRDSATAAGAAGAVAGVTLTLGSPLLDRAFRSASSALPFSPGNATSTKPADLPAQLRQATFSQLPRLLSITLDGASPGRAGRPR